MGEPEPVVREGQILCLRLFDVGEDIDLARAETLLASAPGVVSCARRGLSKMSALAVPLRVELGAREIEIIELPNWHAATLSVHVYDSGSISVTYAIAIAPGTALAELTPKCAALYTSKDLETLARAELAKLLPALGPAIATPHDWAGHENYTILRIHELADAMTPDALVAWPGLGRLLIGEPSETPLAKRHRDEILEYTFGYLEDDLVIVDWNSAILLDPRRDPTLVEMLEFANCHLLNLRYYDDLLDRHTKRIYRELSADNHPGVFDRRFTRLAQDVFRQLVGLSEISERIDNATKVAGDYYVARVYRAAIKRLRVEAWKESIERKQHLVNEAYDMLKTEVELRRGLVLEVTIVVLIVLEIVLALIPGVMH
jgi:hypothetical protein